MNTKRKMILVLGAAILILMILYPPYYGIDRESGGRVHAFIGYHAIWDPPSASEVYQRLTSSSPEGPDPQRLSSFEARINRVRLFTNIVVLGAAVALALFGLRHF